MAAPRVVRRARLAALGAGAALALGCGGAPSGPRADLLLVSIDTLRADRLSCYGYARDTTPVLDRLAAGGVRFATAHAPSSQTAPSHMSFFTGLDPTAHGVHNVHQPRPVDGVPQPVDVPQVSGAVPTLPELLRDAGWRTACFTDRGNLLAEMGFHRGFEHARDVYEPLPRKIAAFKKWLAGAPRDEPLFVFFHTYAVHAPYLPRGAHVGRFTDPGYRGPFRERWEALRNKSDTAFEAAGSFVRPFDGMGAEDVRFLSDLYDEGIATADEELGALWKAWAEARGPDARLAVVSDHGEEFLEHGRIGHARGLSGELVRVPFVLRGPGLPAGTVVTQPVSLVALLPTLLDWVGLSVPECQAESLLPLASNAARAPEPAPLYSQLLGGNRIKRYESVAADGLRLLVQSGEVGARSALYDWSSDPGEQADLSSARPDDVARLAEWLRARRAASEALYQAGEHGRPRAAPALGADALRELEGLGYTGEE